MELITCLDAKSKIGKGDCRNKNFGKSQLTSKWLYSFLLLFLSLGLSAQETVVDIFDLPAPERCVSNDLRVVEAVLEYDQCGPDCEVGEDIIYYPLTLSIFNNTGSERTSFAFYARLEQYDPEGNLTATYFVTGCKGPVPPNAITEITFDDSLEFRDADDNILNFPGIPYLCGGSLKLVNLYEAWTDASDNENRQCTLDSSKIAPKCGIIPSIEIQTPISAFVENVTPVSCYGYSDGAIDITVNGGEDPYTLEWSKEDNGFSASTEDVMNLTAGTYNVKITDAQGCEYWLEDIIVTEPTELEATLDETTDVSCYGDSDGAITIDVTGGTPPYTYAWTGPDGYTASTKDISGLAAGTYSVTVTDANDCTDSINGIEVDEPAELEASLDEITPVSCYGGSDGAITIDVVGGTPDYTYSWTGPDGFTASTQDISGLAAGTYSVTVTDDNGCTDTLSELSVNEPAELEASLDEITPVSCYGGSDGAIAIDVVGGTPDYTYSWTGPDGFTASTQDISGLAAGTYSVTVTDDNGCTDTLSELSVNEPAELEASLDEITPVSCYGGSDGAIAIDVVGGTPDYTYSWTGPDGFTASTQDISGLAAGTYSVTVTDDNGCTDTLNGLIVIQPSELVISLTSVTDAKCDGANDGAIDISVTGGTPPYTYLWSNDATTQDLTGVGAGYYSVTVTDAKGCTDSLEDIEVEDPSSLEVSVKTKSDVSCYGYVDGSIDIDVSGGTSPYTYAWTGPDDFTASTQDISDLAPGNYSVTVTDDNDCERTLSGITIGEPDQVPSPQVQVAPADCFPTAGSFVIISNTTGLEFSLDGGAWFTYTGEITDVASGEHSLVARDVNGCESAPTQFTVPEPYEVPLAPTLSVIQPDCESFTGTILVTSATMGFQFSINGGAYQDYPVGGFSNLAPGDYTVIARSSDGCVSEPAYITLITPICDDFEGCTLGYWKNHTDRWCAGVTSNTYYGSIFANAPQSYQNLTFLQALNAKGGGAGNLLRQSAAAYLNACHPDVNYELSTEQVVSKVNTAWMAGGSTINQTASYLDMLNNAGCPLGGTPATTANRSAEDSAESIDAFAAYPVPFKNDLNVQYNFDYNSKATIQIFNMQGQLLAKYQEPNAGPGKVTNLNLNFNVKRNAIYILQVDTDRASYVKKIISSR